MRSTAAYTYNFCDMPTASDCPMITDETAPGPAINGNASGVTIKLLPETDDSDAPSFGYSISHPIFPRTNPPATRKVFISSPIKRRSSEPQKTAQIKMNVATAVPFCATRQRSCGVKKLAMLTYIITPGMGALAVKIFKYNVIKKSKSTPINLLSKINVFPRAHWKVEHKMYRRRYFNGSFGGMFRFERLIYICNVL